MIPNAINIMIPAGAFALKVEDDTFADLDIRRGDVVVAVEGLPNAGQLAILRVNGSKFHVKKYDGGEAMGVVVGLWREVR